MSHYASPAAASAAATAGRPWTAASPVPVRDRSCGGGKERLLLVVLALAALLVLGSFALQFQWVHREPTDVSLERLKFASRIPIEAGSDTPHTAAAAASFVAPVDGLPPRASDGVVSMSRPPSVLASLATPRRPSPELRVLTYATHAGYKFCWLLSSCQAQELPLVALGWHTTKKGLGYKLTSTLQYLDTLPAGDLVLFVDAFDVVVTRPASEMIQLFESLNADLVFSAEKGCWPYVALPQGEQLCRFYYPPSPTMYRFVNTGSWMGRVGAARKLLRDIQTAHATETLGELNDQELVTDFFVCDYLQQLYKEGGDAAVLQRIGQVFGDTDAKKAAARIPGCNRLDGVVKYGVKLDYECVLFQSLHNSEIDQTIHAPQVMEIHVSFDVASGTWQNINTGSHPAVFHFNGGGKLHIDRIWEKVKKRQPDDSHSIRQYDVDTKKYTPLDFQEVCGK